MESDKIQFKQFKFENYKGIKGPLTVNFDSTKQVPHCLIGDNEAGKTTILKGIETIGKLCRGYELSKGEILAIKPIGSTFGKTVELSAVYIDASTPEEQQEVKFVYQFEESRFINLFVYINGKDTRIQKRLTNLQKHCPEFLYYDDFEIEIPQVVNFSQDEQPDKSKLNGLWVKFFNDIVRVANNTGSDFKEFVLDWDEDDATTIQNRLTKMEDCLSDKVGREWHHITGRQKWFEGFSIERSSKAKEQFHLYVKEGGIRYPLYSRSKGFRWFLCFVLISVFRSAANGRSTIFLLDEPASNVHIAKQEPILESLIKVAKADSTGLIYSTHAPGLIDVERTEPFYCVGRENEEDENSEVSIRLVEEEISFDSANGSVFVVSVYQRKILQDMRHISKKTGAAGLKVVGGGLKKMLGDLLGDTLSELLRNL